MHSHQHSPPHLGFGLHPQPFSSSFRYSFHLTSTATNHHYRPPPQATYKSPTNHGSRQGDEQETGSNPSRAEGWQRRYQTLDQPKRSSDRATRSVVHTGTRAARVPNPATIYYSPKGESQKLCRRSPKAIPALFSLRVWPAHNASYR